MTLIFLVIVCALVFEYIDGFHDTAISIATVVSTKAPTPAQAVLLASSMDLVGALVGTRCRQNGRVRLSGEGTPYLSARFSERRRIGRKYQEDAMTRLLLSLGFAGALYLTLLGLGRWLKRQTGLALAVAYQLFSVSVALWVPFTLLGAEPKMLRFLKSRCR